MMKYNVLRKCQGKADELYELKNTKENDNPQFDDNDYCRIDLCLLYLG